MTKHTGPQKTEILEKCKLTDFLGINLKEKIISPLRPTEQTPSFHVYVGRKTGNEMFVDHGALGTEGYSGDIIKFYMLYYKINFKEALNRLVHRIGVTTPAIAVVRGRQRKRPAGADSECGVRGSKPPTESRYIKQTGLPLPEWVSDGLEAYTDTLGNFCVKTSNGIHVRGERRPGDKRAFSINIGPAGITVFGNPQASIWYVFEGIGNVLALIDGALNDEKHTPDMNCGYLAMHSAGNEDQAITYLSGLNNQPDFVLCYLDRDPAGDRSTKKILDAIVPAIDCRSEIYTGDDVRDVWLSKHK